MADDELDRKRAYMLRLHEVLLPHLDALRSSLAFSRDADQRGRLARRIDWCERAIVRTEPFEVAKLGATAIEVRVFLIICEYREISDEADEILFGPLPLTMH